MFQLKWVWGNLKGKQTIYIIACIISAITSAFLIINPKISQILVNNVIVGVKDANGTVVHHNEQLIPLLLLMIAVQLGRDGLRYIMILFYENSTQHLVVKIREKLFDNIQKQDMSFFDTYRTGDLMTRLTGDLDMVRHTFAWVIYNLIDSFVIFFVTIIFFFTISWQFTLVLVAITPFIFIVTYRFSKKIRPLYIDLREKLSQLNTSAQENISGNRVVKAFNRQEYETEKFREKNEEFQKANLNAAFTWLKFFPVIETMAQSLTVITILLGGLFIIEGQLNYGDLMAFSMLTWAISNPMRMLGILLNDVQKFFASASKVIDLFYSHPKIVSRLHAINFDKRMKGNIKFDKVTFGYGGEIVLDEISLEIKQGQTIGIMGPTGSGKTTLINLIARFYDVKSGRVLLDNIDVRNLDLKKLRSSIGMATQDVFLFSDTVDGNISYSNPDLSEEKVREYASAADADEFIKKMPKGYNTIVGERGVGLSGGQKQRIALARAIAVRPPVLILDDTTSAVDNETEKYIQQKLTELDFPCTKIIIAQRASAVKNADKIIILDHKKIIEQGTHQELINLKGYYYNINRLQQDCFLDEKAGEADGTK
jgi:ATP-binding cassette subfamily B multidrug efflux pump